MKPISVILADDHTMVRAGMRSLLEGWGWVEVLAEAENGREAIDLALKYEPDIILMDIAMKGLNGLEATLQLKKTNLETRVIILSMHSGEEYVLEALRMGASGYLLKGSRAEDLETALKMAMAGDIYLSPTISKLVVDDYIRRISGESGYLSALSSRQREILQLIAEGNSTKVMAKMLHVSVKTIETHRAQLMDRLDIHDVPGLVRFAIRTGLVSADQ